MKKKKFLFLSGEPCKNKAANNHPANLTKKRTQHGGGTMREMQLFKPATNPHHTFAIFISLVEAVWYLSNRMCLLAAPSTRTV